MGGTLAEIVRESSDASQFGSLEDPEFEAMRTVYAALRDLDQPAQNRVLDYVSRRLSLRRANTESVSTIPLVAIADTETNTPGDDPDANHHETGLEGVSPVAQRWMRRNGLTSTALSHLFSLGVDEIDLVAKSVPGKTAKDRMRSVLLLKGAASYLGSGVARVSFEELKEACVHYDAYDSSNFSKYMGSLASEASGTKESGYTVTTRGLAAATEMIKGLVSKE